MKRFKQEGDYFLPYMGDQIMAQETFTKGDQAQIFILGQQVTIEKTKKSSLHSNRRK